MQWHSYNIYDEDKHGIYLGHEKKNCIGVTSYNEYDEDKHGIYLGHKKKIVLE